MTIPPPPLARPIPAERRQHGDLVTDDYAWLTARDNPEVIAYLEAENAYTDEVTARLARLRDTVFAEIKARTQETDLTVPARKGGWWYYTRTVEGQQYAIYCRRAAGPDEVTLACWPTMATAGRRADPARRQRTGSSDASFFELGAFSVSPDGRRLGYSTDFRGDERFTLRIKDLGTGAELDDEIPGTFYGCAWSLDGSAVFYVTVDDAWRPYRVWRHAIGTPAADDVIVFEEPDERFWVGVSLTRSEGYLVIKTESRLTGEAWLLDAADPAGELRVVAPRRQGVEYDVEHQPDSESGDRLLILHNDQVENFELATAPIGRPGEWQPLIGHREDTRLLGVDAFAGHMVVWYRREGRTGLAVYRDGTALEIPFPEPIYSVSPGSNPQYRSDRFRLGYESLATPASVYDCDVATGELTLLRRRPVLPCPADGRSAPATTPSTASGRWPATAPGSRSRWSARRARRGTAAPRACSTATAATRARLTRTSARPGCRCWTAGSCSRSRTCAAAARWAGAGTRGASS